MQRIWTILFLLAPWLAAGADQPLALPDWLVTPQEATSVTTTASGDASVDLSYLLPLPPTEVTSKYQKRLEKAKVRFKTSFDGIGDTISASTETISCMVRIAEAGSGSHVRVDCAPEIAQPSPLVPNVQSLVANPGQATPPKGPKDVHGWSQARWGMTQEQVLSAFPGEANIPTDDPSNRLYGPRGLATVGIDHADIGGIPVRVHFLFDPAGKLDGIRLPAESVSPSADQFARVGEALTRQYGLPALLGASMATIPKTEAGVFMAWVFPTSVIKVTYFPTGWLTTSIDKRSNQTAESIRAGLAGYLWMR